MMKQDKSVKKNSSDNGDTEQDSNENNDTVEMNNSGIDSGSVQEKTLADKLLVQEQLAELLQNDDIILAVANFKADSEEQEIALDYANSHIQFLTQIVESDRNKGVVRSDVEIRDLVSHVNLMLKKKDEYLFTTIVMYSPSHYREMQRKL